MDEAHNIRFGSFTLVTRRRELLHHGAINDLRQLPVHGRSPEFTSSRDSVYPFGLPLRIKTGRLATTLAAIKWKSRGGELGKARGPPSNRPTLRSVAKGR